MKRKLVIVFTLCSIVLGSLSCVDLPKEKGNPRGAIPWVITGFDKKYAPRADEDPKGNLIRYDFK